MKSNSIHSKQFISFTTMTTRAIFKLSGFLFFTIFFHFVSGAQEMRFSGNNGTISFTSDAPLEIIKASSDALRGILDITEQNFAFTIPIESFQGFNSPLQREHFRENYMETTKFPTATFSGRIVEQLDLSKPGTYEIRAKGMLNIHGVSRERIIRCLLIVSEEEIQVSSSFSVYLRDHDISIPRMVYQKIAEEIAVEVSLVLRPVN
jgi:hypothetical protein